jgi:hypothetical protein
MRPQLYEFRLIQRVCTVLAVFTLKGFSLAQSDLISSNSRVFNPPPVLDDQIRQLLQGHATQEERLDLEKTYKSTFGLNSPSERAKLFEDYLTSHPLGIAAVRVMSSLGQNYSQMGRHKDAEKMLSDAVMLAGSDPYSNILHINHAHVLAAAGELNRAEAELDDLIRKSSSVDEDTQTSEVMESQLNCLKHPWSLQESMLRPADF